MWLEKIIKLIERDEWYKRFWEIYMEINEGVK